MCRDADEKEDRLRGLGVTHMVETAPEAAQALLGLVPHVYVIGESPGGVSPGHVSASLLQLSDT
jgi:hypothetical protein